MFEQDRVLVRLQQYILQDTQISACFLAGSFGRGSNDDYSDLDLILVFIDDATRERAYSKRKEFVREVLPYVPAKSFDAFHVKPYLHIALYGNGAKVDFMYETLALKPSFALRDMRVLKDSNYWGAEYLKQCALRPPTRTLPTISIDDLVDIDNRFWVMFMDTYRRLLRGEHDKPFSTYLELQFFTLPVLTRLLPPEDPAYQDLIELYFSRDAPATLSHVQNLMNVYLRARDAIVMRHQLAFVTDQSFERDLKRKIGL